MAFIELVDRPMHDLDDVEEESVEVGERGLSACFPAGKTAP